MKINTLLRQFLPKFTTDTDFHIQVETELCRLRNKIELESTTRGDTLAETGMIGLAIHAKEKSSRIFSKVAGKRRSTEKFEDELMDNLAYALYLVVYWRMLCAGKASKDT